MSPVTHCILLLAVFLGIAESGTTENVIQYECKQIPRKRIGLCADHFGRESWYGRFPNARGLDLDDSIVEFFHFFALLYQNNYCSHMLLNVLCFHYFPLCSPECPDIGVTPCRQLCTEAVATCLPYAHVLYGDTFNKDFPHILNCSNFADTTSQTAYCGSNTSSGFDNNAPCCFTETEVALECPNASTYVRTYVSTL